MVGLPESKKGEYNGEEDMWAEVVAHGVSRQRRKMDGNDDEKGMRVVVGWRQHGE